MLIGLDFDNTIAGYDSVFVAAAISDKLLVEGEASSKVEVKRALQQRPKGEQDWMRLQGRVYGAYMHRADLIEGVDRFLKACKLKNVPICIVSHKTEYGHFDPEKVNLRSAARQWMEKRGFFDPDIYALMQDSVYFETTREEKVSRITELGCTHFVDDLIEVFQEPGFPHTTKPLLYSPGHSQETSFPIGSFSTWNEILDDILG